MNSKKLYAMTLIAVVAISFQFIMTQTLFNHNEKGVDTNISNSQNGTTLGYSQDGSINLQCVQLPCDSPLLTNSTST